MGLVAPPAVRGPDMAGRTAVNLVLLAAVAALAALAYFLPASKPPPGPPALTGLTPAQIHRVRISHAGKPAIVLVRKGEDWRMVKPIQVRANRFIIHSLLGITRTDSYSRFTAGQRDLSEFGLDEPSLRLRLNDLDIAFGAAEPLNGRRYVQSGAMVHVISNLYYQEASGGVADFVSRVLLPEDVPPVKLVFPDKVLERDDQGHWEVSAGGRGTGQGARDLVDQWRHAQALEVKPYSGTGAHPSVRVTFGKDHPPLRFEIVRKDPELILARPDIGMAYHFTASQAKKLLHLPAGGDKGDASPGGPAGRPHA